MRLNKEDIKERWGGAGVGDTNHTVNGEPSKITQQQMVGKLMAHNNSFNMGSNSFLFSHKVNI